LPDKTLDLPEEYWPALEELPGDLGLIASAVEEHHPGLGVEVALIISQYFRSQELYIHSVDRLSRQWRNDTIRHEFDNGASIRDLATKWRISQRWIEDILGRPESSGMGKQLSLFGGFNGR